MPSARDDLPPMPIAMPQPNAAQVTPRHGPVTPLALVVDDEPGIRETLRDALSDAGLDVVAVPTVAEALEQLARLQYDVAIVDICLPDGSGADVIERSLSCSPPVPAVAITGLADTETMLHCLELGAIACLWKPFRLEALEKIVRRALDQRGRAGGAA